MGGGKFWGHPGGTGTEKNWVDWINQNVSGGRGGAYMSSLQGVWDGNAWAQYDRNPGDSNFI